MKLWGPLLGALIVAAALKAALLVADVVPFNSDEAVVALMARHILRGARPVFFYGQAYLGSLDAWLVAGAFALMGESVAAIRLVQVGLYLGVVAVTYQLGLKIYANRWIASAAALFLAVPTVLVTLYTTATIGGYGETLLIGNGLLLLAIHLNHLLPHTHTPMHFFLFGLLSGLGFWTFPLVGVYLLPAVCYVIVTIIRRRPATAASPFSALRSSGLLNIRAGRLWRDYLLPSSSFLLPSSFGFLLGASPWLWATLTHGSATFSELSGSAIAGASPANPALALFAHTFNFLLFGLTVIFGLRPPWWSASVWLALPLAPLALALSTALLIFIARQAIWARDAARAGRWLLVGTCLANTAAFILTPFGADPSGRYFLPLAAPLALLLAEMLFTLRARQKALAHGLAFGVIAFHAWGTLQSAAAFPPGVTTQFDAVAQVDQRGLPEVMAFLRTHGETRGYANYWVTFPLAFLSGEDLIYEARLPYHLDFRYTERDNRYRPYAQAVAASARAAYITTRHPPLDERLRAGLTQLNVAFAEQQIGDYHIFYALSRKVIPEELGLGTDCCPP